MNSSTRKARTSDSASASAVAAVSVLTPVLFIAGLLFYKWKASLAAIESVSSSGILSMRTDVIAVGQGQGLSSAVSALNYFSVIWPALTFGVLISAAVRVFVPTEWFFRLFSGPSFRPQLKATAAGAPLMLCSCCVAPVFTSVYERSSRLGPSLTLMLASPSLNPAALVLTFLLFAPRIAAARLFMSVVTVLFAGFLVERFLGNGIEVPIHSERESRMTFANASEAFRSFFRSLGFILARTLPALVLGVVFSMFFVGYLPAGILASNDLRHLVVVLTALIAVPLAVPTFFEIPLALGLLAAGAPAGAAAAMLFAAPALNLPSLLTVARSTNWKVATGLAFFVWSVATFGGLLL